MGMPKSKEGDIVGYTYSLESHTASRHHEVGAGEIPYPSCFKSEFHHGCFPLAEQALKSPLGL